MAGGICGILWSFLSVAYWAAYPIAAGGSMAARATGPEAFAARWTELGQRSAVLALEWSRAATPLLLLPFLLSLYRLLEHRGQKDLAMVAAGLGLVGMALMIVAGIFHPTLTHTLAQAQLDAESAAEAAAIYAVLRGLLAWYRGLNRVASLLYQGFVGLLGVGLILSRTWRGWGWVGAFGAVLALVAKATPGLVGVSAFTWTGLAYFVWPIALGVGLLRTDKEKVRAHAS